MSELTGEWSNDDLQEYYDNGDGSIAELDSFAKIAGLDNGCDIELVVDYIRGSSSILEVGAGYGRALKGILNQGYKKSLTAIERSQKMCDYLKENFQEKIDIVHDDVRRYHFDKKFDVILLLWSHIAEYPQKQQGEILKILLPLLNKGGVVIADNGVPIENGENSVVKTPEFYNLHGQSYTIKSSYGILCGYVPSPNEINTYANQAGFSKIEQKYYLTEKGRPRISYILHVDEAK